MDEFSDDEVQEQVTSVTHDRRDPDRIFWYVYMFITRLWLLQRAPS